MDHIVTVQDAVTAFADFMEPTDAELDAIEREMPVIMAGVELLDAQIITMDRTLTELDVRRIRRARRRLHEVGERGNSVLNSNDVVHWVVISLAGGTARTAAPELQLRGRAPLKSVDPAPLSAARTRRAAEATGRSRAAERSDCAIPRTGQDPCAPPSCSRRWDGIPSALC